MFSSKKFPDPATPLLEAYVGEPVTIRLLNPAERRRSYSFHVHGHYWRNDELDINTSARSTVGQITTGYTDNFFLFYGAGGWFGIAGDYMYRAGNIRWAIEQGLWGIMRIHKEEQQLLNKKIRKANKLLLNLALSGEREENDVQEHVFQDLQGQTASVFIECEDIQEFTGTVHVAGNDFVSLQTTDSEILITYQSIAFTKTDKKYKIKNRLMYLKWPLVQNVN